ncbi:hypothetical protein AMAG_04393 [Allomyces macrogynus ATCC 38327]|uniref:Cytochrome b561 domain-containing protein n=1 Tax=Allomyces macrogynus (strain ATCC 38327) TaxID=578462 RepID=A0A0L0S8X2_ALLM3|nr:hypothetical protein AMAG_04393 [Allomyces macrogynus ATCC 38327]|eukprot:KNE58855.1 hypothetical protein AMAG_04393 [Allomyces macrogynus ATCC 38327]
MSTTAARFGRAVAVAMVATLALFLLASSTASARPASRPSGSSATSGVAGTPVCVDSKLCVSMVPANNGASVDVTINTTVAGWAGIGLGSSMSNADCLMVWKDSSGKWTVSRRYATSHDLPTAASSQNVQIVASSASSVTVRRPATLSASAKDQSFSNSSQSFIWAYATSAVSGSNFARHVAEGSFSYNALTADASGSDAKAASDTSVTGSATGSNATAASLSGMPVVCPSSKLCVAMGIVPGNTSFVDVLLNTTISSGWIGIGIGSSMKSADVLMAWRENNQWVVSRRHSTGHDTPSPATKQAIQVVASTASTVTVRRPVTLTASSGDQSFTNSSQTFIWAVADGVAASTGNLGMHRSEGTFVYNAFSAEGTAASADQRSTMIAVHGILMAVAWSFLSFMGVFAARFLKNKWPKTWFPVHRALLGLAVLLTIIGFAVMVVATDGNHFGGLHGKIGLAVTAGCLAQGILGFLIDRWFDANRTEVPWWDKLHWYLGYLVGLGGPVNVVLGHLKNDTATWLLTVNVAVMGVFVIAFIWGQVTLGQQHEHQAMPLVDKNGSADRDQLGANAAAGPTGDQHGSTDVIAPRP